MFIFTVNLLFCCYIYKFLTNFFKRINLNLTFKFLTFFKLICYFILLC